MTASDHWGIFLCRCHQCTFSSSDCSSAPSMAARYCGSSLVRPWMMSSLSRNGKARSALTFSGVRLRLCAKTGSKNLAKRKAITVSPSSTLNLWRNQLMAPFAPSITSCSTRRALIVASFSSMLRHSDFKFDQLACEKAVAAFCSNSCVENTSGPSPSRLYVKVTRCCSTSIIAASSRRRVVVVFRCQNSQQLCNCPRGHIVQLLQEWLHVSKVQEKLMIDLP